MVKGFLGLVDGASDLFKLGLETINGSRVIADRQILVIDLSIKRLELRGNFLIMLDLSCLKFSDLIVHNMEDVFVLPCLVEYSIVELFSVDHGLFKPDIVFFSSGLRGRGDISHWPDHFIADVLDTGFNIEPVELVHFVRYITIIEAISLNFCDTRPI